MNFEQEFKERWNAELKKAKDNPEYVEYLRAGFKVEEKINGGIAFFNVENFDSHSCTYTFEFESGYTKNDCLKLKKLIKEEIVKQTPFNEKSIITENGMTYYKWGKFWEWSFNIF